ncbi:hypothetical protein Tco_0747594 [Tanacetum coccineum]|uniref:Reverse transcriptase domain-containing protein n=1 Tax=Tanacetum coccineum TaxID=301880 RepID=A0ABQ4YWN2_9ASTR
MKVFTLIIAKEVKECKDFKYHLRCKDLYLTHMCFVDDLLIIFHGDVKSVKGDLKKGSAKIAWKEVCKPKSHGGLRIKLLGPWNETLLVKHIWNIANRKETLWVKWVHAVKLKGRSFWDIDHDSNDS